MKVQITIMVLVCVCLAAFGNPMDMDFDKARPTYSKGANDALDAITLLSLELSLKGERKTWGEMCDIVRKRLNVEKEASHDDK